MAQSAAEQDKAFGRRALSALRVHQELAVLFPAARVISVSDATYNVVTEGAVKRFLQELTAALWEEGITAWHPFFDCDNFALEAWALACRKHRAAGMAGMPVAEGVAFGVYSFNVNGEAGQGHRRALYRNAQGWKFLETVYPPRPAPMNDAERLSAWEVMV